MTPIIARLQRAEEALTKNGFVLVGDVWVAPDSGRDAALDDAAIKAFFNARNFYPENIQRQSAFFDSVRELIAQHATHPANGAQADLVAKISLLRIRGVNYEHGVEPRQLVDRAEVLALLGGAS